MFKDLTWVDFAILGTIACSVLLGMWRGLMREALALAAWIAAFAVSLLFFDRASVVLAGYIDPPSLRLAIAFAGLFLLTLLVGALITHLIAGLVDKTGLSGTDRMLGLVFGVLRGVAIVGLLVLLAGLTPLPQDPWWNESLLLPRFVDLATFLRDLVPESYAKYFAFGPAVGGSGAPAPIQVQ